MSRLNRLWSIGRHSELAYIRFYPNPGFMVPIGPRKRLVWSKFYGWATRAARRKP